MSIWCHLCSDGVAVTQDGVCSPCSSRYPIQKSQAESVDKRAVRLESENKKMKEKISVLSAKYESLRFALVGIVSAGDALGNEWFVSDEYAFSHVVDIARKALEDGGEL